MYYHINRKRRKNKQNKPF